MTDKNDTKNWHKNQDWIKDVLSKSGTELMEITATTSKNGAAKKTSRKNGNKEIQQNKMVYYQSTPLIVKTEPPSQAQFCTPLATPGAAHNTAASSTLVPQQLHQLQSQHAPHNYSISNGAIILQQAPQSAAAPTATSINNVHMQNFSSAAQNLNFLSNIKAELLPPSITVYATSSSSNVSVPAPTSAHATLQPSAPTASLPISATPNAGGSSTTTNATAAGRKTAANKPQFKCEQCGMTFGSKSAHTSHTKSHAKNGDLAALNGLAGPSTSAAAAAAAAALELNEAGVPLGIPKTPQIKPNASGVPGSDPYQCNVCQKTFAVPARLIRHYRTHTGERPFECEFCHKLFSVKENLQVHRRIHTKERPYGCDVCGRAFEHSGKLHRHMRIHTGERPHKCAVCEKTFIQSGQLVIHMRTHTGEKPYKCPVEGCGKGFTCSKQLKVHSRTHTGEKPYHCDICFRDFGYNHVLKLHRVQHYGSKCYKCTICDETFKSKKEMEAHIKGHANEMPDDDDEAAVGASASSGGQTSSTSTSGSGGETTSAPGSPQSPSNGVNTSASVRRPRKPKQRVAAIAALAPLSPSSPRSTLSPSSSRASASRLSAGSPASSIASPAMSIIIETDQHSHDSGVASTSNNRQLCELVNAAATTMLGMHNPSAYCLEELPTDLSIQQQQQHQQQQSPTTANYYQQQPHQQQQKLQANNNSVYQQSQSSYNYMRHSPVPLAPASPLLMPFDQQQSPQHYQQGGLEPPTINPALVEAASIASRHAMLEPREEDVTAALQIMQLTRTHKPTQQQQQQPHLNSPQLQAIQHPTPTASPNYITTQQQRPLLISDLANYDDTHEANELIEHYKRGDLARHGIHKGYAPVPKFEPALPNNENLVRQVEAALAPLRSSTESPERSSSPESDSMMMADRDVMTLPLRKRKLYMNEGPNETPKPDSQANNSGGLDATGNNNSGNINGVGINADLGNKVMRMNSVIQFAKAS